MRAAPPNSRRARMPSAASANSNATSPTSRASWRRRRPRSRSRSQPRASPCRSGRKSRAGRRRPQALPPAADRAQPTRYGRAELHVAGDVSNRYKKKRRVKGRPVSMGSDARHAFEMPTTPQKREVALGETITVAELAAKMAIKATEVIKVLMNIGIMATINQPLDQETAVLVVEELGHTAETAARRPDRG